MKQITLLEIKRTTAVTTRAIAERARLSIADVFTVETGGYSSGEKAQQVLAAFNQLSGMKISLQDIKLRYISASVLSASSFPVDANKSLHKVRVMR